MRKINKLLLFGMLSLFVATGCSDRSKKAKPEELKVEPVSVQQMSDYRTVFYNKLTEESDRRIRGRSFEDSIANYFDRLSFLTEEEKSLLLQEELEWKPMVKRLEELDREMMQVNEKYYLHYGSVLLEYSAAQARSLKTWSHFTELSHPKEAPSYGDPKVKEEMMNSEFLTEEEKKQLIKDEETMERLKPEVEKIENAIEFETYDEEQEKWKLIEQMVAIRAENREIWNRIHTEYGEDLESYITDAPMDDFETWERAQQNSKDRKRDQLAKEWREELPFLNQMRDLEESIEKFFPQLPFLTEEEKKALLDEEVEWKAEIAKFDEQVKKNEEIRQQYMEKHRDLFDRVNEIETRHGEIRRKMEEGFRKELRGMSREHFFRERYKSEEDWIRESDVLSEEEKKLLLEDLAILRELGSKESEVNDEIEKITVPIHELKEQLYRRLEEIHTKNRTIWEKILQKGLKLEIATKYIPPVASDEWFQEK